MMRSVFALAAAMLLAAPAMAQGDGWTVGQTPPGSGTCSAARPGPEVNTRLMRNNLGQMILVAAKSEWKRDGSVAAKLSIDGAAPKTVLASMVGPLLLVLVDQPELEAKLRAAKTLQWTLPWGVFSAEVGGLGAAWDKLADC